MQEDSFISDRQSPSKNDFYNNDTKIEGKSMFNRQGKSESNDILIINKKNDKILKYPRSGEKSDYTAIDILDMNKNVINCFDKISKTKNAKILKISNKKEKKEKKKNEILSIEINHVKIPTLNRLQTIQDIANEEGIKESEIKENVNFYFLH